MKDALYQVVYNKQGYDRDTGKNWIEREVIAGPLIWRDAMKRIKEELENTRNLLLDINPSFEQEMVSDLLIKIECNFTSHRVGQDGATAWEIVPIYELKLYEP